MNVYSYVRLNNDSTILFILCHSCHQTNSVTNISITDATEVAFQPLNLHGEPSPNLRDITTIVTVVIIVKCVLVSV